MAIAPTQFFCDNLTERMHAGDIRSPRTVPHRKNCTQPVGSVREGHLWERPHAGVREESEDEGASPTKQYGLTPFPVPLRCLGGEGRRGRWEEGGFVLPLVITAPVCYR